METYTIHIGGLTRELPIVPLTDKLSIAALVIFGDTEVVEPCARALAEKLPPVDYLITAEAKSIPLIYEMAKVMKMPRYIIARKSVKGYMSHPIITHVNSITTKSEQILCLDEEDSLRIRGKRVAIVDDVISTGASLAAIEQLVNEACGEIVARAAILSEGDANDREDITVLDKIPLFFREEKA